MALTDSLVSYWKLDEASGTRADSHGANNLTDNNTVTQAAGIISNAAVFNSANSEYLSCTALSLTGEMTVQAWMKANGDYTNILAIVSNLGSGGSGGDYHLEFGRTDNKFTFWNSGGGIAATSTGTIADDNWHHIVVVRTGSTGNWSVQFYIDGADAGLTTGITLNPGSPSNFAIGRGGAFASFYFKGTLDEVAMWSRGLSGSEVTSLYGSGSGLAYPLTVGGTVIPAVDEGMLAGGLQEMSGGL